MDKNHLESFERVVASKSVRSKLERENQELREEIDNLRNGLKGSCLACEPVGEINQTLLKIIKEYEFHISVETIPKNSIKKTLEMRDRVKKLKDEAGI